MGGITPPPYGIYVQWVIGEPMEQSQVIDLRGITPSENNPVLTMSDHWKIVVEFPESLKEGLRESMRAKYDLRPHCVVTEMQVSDFEEIESRGTGEVGALAKFNDLLTETNIADCKNVTVGAVFEKNDGTVVVAGLQKSQTQNGDMYYNSLTVTGLGNSAELYSRLEDKLATHHVSTMNVKTNEIQAELFESPLSSIKFVIKPE